MPVPSTMMEFRLTMVRTPNGWLTSQQTLIMGKGPMATTSSVSRCRSRSICRTWLTNPLCP